jgi:hypothetical protein
MEVCCFRPRRAADKAARPDEAAGKESSVMIPTGDNRNRLVRNAIHESVFVIDPARPAALELMG